MADGLVQVPPDSTGKKVDTSEITVGANTVERQRVVIADTTSATQFAAVANSSLQVEEICSIAPGTTAPSQVEICGGKSNDGTPQYQPIPLGPAGRSVVVEGVASGVALSSKITDGVTTVSVIAGTTALKSDTSSVAGTATVTAAAGVQKVGIVGNASATVDGAINGAAPTNALWNTNAPATDAAAACLVKNAAALTVLNVKASAGNVYGITVVNKAATVIYLQFYNTAGTPTLGTSVVWWIPIAASATLVIPPGTYGLNNHATGIGIGASTTPTSTGTPATAPDVSVWYK